MNNNETFKILITPSYIAISIIRMYFVKQPIAVAISSTERTILINADIHQILLNKMKFIKKAYIYM